VSKLESVKKNSLRHLKFVKIREFEKKLLKFVKCEFAKYGCMQETKYKMP